ncbi:Protein HOL1 [Candida viswanathii]|uniref:Protein HOL1 n=1 Tax=Candida viswanathii TaxID=5486 RepID=A0A367YCR7_9ASCO|nr:Protein HOL1 [Candida viswanathii]
MSSNVPAEYYDENFIPGTTNILTGRHTPPSTDESSSITSEKSLKRDPKTGLVLMPQPTDSPNDPLNWSTRRKIWQLILLSFITALTAAISNDAGASQDSLNEIYGISYDLMNTGAGVLFLFIGWSCIVFAPASSLYGRRITYLVCLLAGTLGCVWFGASRRTADTIWSQAFVGMSEACAEAQVQQSLTDLFFSHNLGAVLTLYISATSIGSFLGPLIAQYESYFMSFRWVGWWGAIITGGCLVVTYFGCEETVFERNLYTEVYESKLDVKETHEECESKKNELDDTKELEHEVSHEVESSTTNPLPLNIDPETNSETTKPYIQRIALITPASYLQGLGFKQYAKRFLLYFKVFTLPGVWFSGLLWGLQDAYMTFFLTTQDTYFYEEPWNYSNAGVAIMNVATLIGAVVGCIVLGLFSDYHVIWLAKRNHGVMEAEYRLYLLIITLVISPVGLIMFGVGAARNWPWQVIYVGLGFIGFGWGSIGDTSMSYLMEAYPDIVIQGMVGVSIINNTLACIFTFTCSYWLDASGTQNTYIALSVIDFATIALVFPLLHFGKTFRKQTKGTYVSMVELTQGMG